MAAAARLNLGSKVMTGEVLDRCRPQVQLYTEKLLGRDEKTAVSKFKTKVQSLFPVGFQNQSLELRDIEITDAGSEDDGAELEPEASKGGGNGEDKGEVKTDIASDSFKASVKLEWLCYGKIQGILYVQHRKSITLPLIKFPKLSASDTLNVNGIEKVLISQLGRQPGLRIEADEKSISVGFLRDNATMFQIHASCKTCTALCEGKEVELLQALMALGVTKSNIVKVLHNVKTVVFKDGGWCEVRFREFAKENENEDGRLSIFEAYGWRRNTRFGEDIVPIGAVENAVVVEDVVSYDKRIVLKAGERMMWDVERLGCGYVRIADAAAVTTMKLLKNVREAEGLNLVASLVASKLSLVDLELAGRSALNAITKRVDGAMLNCVTKRDLILIWEMLAKGKWFALRSAAKVRIARGVGDMIIDAVVRVLRYALSKGKIMFTFEALLDGRAATVVRGLQASVDRLFTTSGLCQFADQVNSLTELSQKVRFTYLGEGGVTTQTAESFMREVQPWHFGRLCPVGTPEGENVGLVTELTMYANIEDSGHLVTAYNKVRNGLISNQRVYISWFDSKRFLAVVQTRSLTLGKTLGRTPRLSGLSPRQRKSRIVDICLLHGAQMFSYAANLVPFLEHNDPTRAAMAANMQKQAVPLLTPQPPLVGTGMESAVMKATNHNIVADSNCIVVSMDANKVVVFDFRTKKLKMYEMPKTKCTNQNTCSRTRVVVKPRQILAAGDVIGECQSSAKGEMSLGVNLTVAFMCWGGLNYEDSVLLSEDVVARGDFLSFHFLEFKVNICNTEMGEERTTNDLPTISLKHRAHLPASGIVTVGTIVREGDVLVGKLCPTRQRSRFQRIWRADAAAEIHVSHDDSNEDSGDANKDADGGDANSGDASMACAAAYIEAGGVSDAPSDAPKVIRYASDTSMRVPMGTKFASVVEVSRTSDERASFVDKFGECIESYKAIRRRYARRICAINRRAEDDASFDSEVQDDLALLSASYDAEIDNLFQKLWAFETISIASEKSESSRIIDVIRVKLLVRRSIQAGDKICGRHGNKGVVSRVLAREDMPFTADGKPIDIVLNPLGVPSRMNFGQILETHFGLISMRLGLEFKRVLEMFNVATDVQPVLKLARSKLSEIYPELKADKLDQDGVLNIVRELAKGVKLACSPFEKMSESRIEALCKRVGLPDTTGQQVLYDGRTGLPFDRKVTVGSIYIFKLNHMVDDKLHARSTGPYSVVTQQPLKGKTNKGGQRLGEMEVWALQAHGAAYTIKEALTSKCDDVVARQAMFLSIMRDARKIISTWGESFLVLIKELRALCIRIKLE